MRRELRSRELARATRALREASAPVVLVGPGAHGAMQLVRALASRLGAAVLTTPDAKSMFDETSPYAGGVFSFGSTAGARQIVEACDVVVAVGTNLGEFASQGGRGLAHAAIVHVTDDPLDVPIGISAVATLLGDVAIEVRALLHAVESRRARDRWFDGLPRPAAPHRAADTGSGNGMDPSQAMRAIGEALPRPSRIACDVTSAGLHALHELTLGPDRRLWIQIEKSACMGSALSAGLGVRLASGLPTLVVIGDWGLMMGQTELHTAASLNVGQFAIVVWSNSGGALIRHGVRAQRIDVPPETHSWRAPRFEVVADGYGMRSLTVRSPRALRRAAAAALRGDMPVLIDAVIDPEGEIPGAQARFLHLESSKRPS